MNLRSAKEGKEYIIQKIDTDDEELNAFLFSLGCYSGETITVVSHLKSSCIVSKSTEPLSSTPLRVWKFFTAACVFSP